MSKIAHNAALLSLYSIPAGVATSAEVKVGISEAKKGINMAAEVAMAMGTTENPQPLKKSVRNIAT